VTGLEEKLHLFLTSVLGVGDGQFHATPILSSERLGEPEGPIRYCEKENFLGPARNRTPIPWHFSP
jgi:hypothetical protein